MIVSGVWGRLVICNSTKTPLHDQADMCIVTHPDAFLRCLMPEIGFKIPEYKFQRSGTVPPAACTGVAAPAPPWSPRHRAWRVRQRGENSAVVFIEAWREGGRYSAVGVGE